jgi:hypothetical protein
MQATVENGGHSGERIMHSIQSIGKGLVIVSVAVFILLLGTRLQTLTFGQVIPEKRADGRIDELQAQVTNLKAQLRSQERVSERLRDDLQQSRARISVLADQLAEVVANPPATETTASASAPPSVVRRGDSAEVVRRAFGVPASVSHLTGSESWYFNGPRFHKVVFRDGKVYEWTDMPIEP